MLNLKFIMTCDNPKCEKKIDVFLPVKVDERTNDFHLEGDEELLFENFGGNGEAKTWYDGILINGLRYCTKDCYKIHDNM